MYLNSESSHCLNTSVSLPVESGSVVENCLFSYRSKLQRSVCSISQLFASSLWHFDGKQHDTIEFIEFLFDKLETEGSNLKTLFNIDYTITYKCVTCNRAIPSKHTDTAIRVVFNRDDCLALDNRLSVNMCKGTDGPPCAFCLKNSAQFERSIPNG